MKLLSLFLLLFAFGLHAQIGETAIFGEKGFGRGASFLWGDTDDSTNSLLQRGRVTKRDSSGTWIVSDSCSKPMPAAYFTTGTKNGSYARWKDEIDLSVRRSANNDSSAIILDLDSRYCSDAINSTGCEAWVSHGSHFGNSATPVLDSVYVDSSTTTLTRRSYFPKLPSGDQWRACLDGHLTGGQTTDSTFLSLVNPRFQ